MNEMVTFVSGLIVNIFIHNSFLTYDQIFTSSYRESCAFNQTLVRAAHLSRAVGNPEFSVQSAGGESAGTADGYITWSVLNQSGLDF